MKALLTMLVFLLLPPLLIPQQCPQSCECGATTGVTVLNQNALSLVDKSLAVAGCDAARGAGCLDDTCEYRTRFTLSANPLMSIEIVDEADVGTPDDQSVKMMVGSVIWGPQDLDFVQCGHVESWLVREDALHPVEYYRIDMSCD